MDRKILPAQRVPVQPPAEAAKRALYKDFPWRQGEFRDFFVGSHAKTGLATIQT
jgi:hypothetical protein